MDRNDITYVHETEYYSSLKKQLPELCERLREKELMWQVQRQAQELKVFNTIRLRLVPSDPKLQVRCHAFFKKCSEMSAHCTFIIFF